MTPLRRWCVVAVLALVVVAVPFAPRLLPVADPDTSAADLLAQVQGSAEVAYSGYVESDGRVQIPVGDRFSDLGDLFGDFSRVRVWWDGPDTWRVARLGLTGEDDVVHARGRTTTYNYEDARAITSRTPELRLPGTVDVVPPSMARIALAGATAAEVSRLPARRVAGIAAPGLRYEPTSERTTIDHVDVWVDPGSGVALRLEATSHGADQPDFTTAFAEFDAGRPEAADVGLRASEQVDRDFEETFDLVDAANRYADYPPPRKLAGLRRTSSGRGAVAVYGVGVERIIAVPLREREAEPLREALQKSAGARIVTIEARRIRSRVQLGDAPAVVVGVGPLGVIITGDEETGGDGWLVAGTVTADTLQRAARDLTFPRFFVTTRFE